jgi:hypothetical protein
MKHPYFFPSALNTAEAEQFDKRAIADRSADGTILGFCIGLSIYICIAIPMLVNQVSPIIIHMLCVSLLSGSAILGAFIGALLGWHLENGRLRRSHNKIDQGAHPTPVNTSLIRRSPAPRTPTPTIRHHTTRRRPSVARHPPRRLRILCAVAAGNFCFNAAEKIISKFEINQKQIIKHRRFPMITDDFRQTPRNWNSM